MNYQERHPDELATLQAAMDGRQAQIWTAMPASIVSVSEFQGMLAVTVQPLTKGVVTDKTLKSSYVSLPVIQDVPVCFPRGGGFMLTMPLAVGDEVLIVFASRDFSSWWQSGGQQQPIEPRMHDLSDAFCIPGVWNKTSTPGSISGASAQLRSIDGGEVIDLAPGAISITAPTIKLNGNVQVAGTVQSTGEITAITTPLHQHHHLNSGGSGLSGAATP